MPSQAFSCFDFSIRSEIPLPGLSPAAQDGETRRDTVKIGLGKVPAPKVSAEQWSAEPFGSAALLEIRGVARYLIDNTIITVEPAPGASDRAVRLFLLGSALGILCHQRGLFPLHANAIVADGAAFAFAGPSGAGKSTLAAHFARAGYPVLCDDVCAVGRSDGEDPVVWPGLPRIKLWQDALTELGYDHSQLERVAEHSDKFHLPLEQLAPEQPAPLRRLYVLEKAPPSTETGITRLRGKEAMQAVLSQTYRREYLASLGLAPRHFAICAALANRIETYRVRRSWGYSVFERELGMLRDHLEKQLP